MTGSDIDSIEAAARERHKFFGKRIFNKNQINADKYIIDFEKKE